MLHEVRRCRRWASAPGAAGLVFNNIFITYFCQTLKKTLLCYGSQDSVWFSCNRSLSGWIFFSGRLGSHCMSSLSWLYFSCSFSFFLFFLLLLIFLFLPESVFLIFLSFLGFFGQLLLSRSYGRCWRWLRRKLNTFSFSSGTFIYRVLPTDSRQVPKFSTKFALAPTWSCVMWSALTFLRIPDGGWLSDSKNRAKVQLQLGWRLSWA